MIKFLPFLIATYATLCLSLPSIAQDAFCGAWFTTEVKPAVSRVPQQYVGNVISTGSLPSPVYPVSAPEMKTTVKLANEPGTVAQWSLSAGDINLTRIGFNCMLVGVPIIVLLYFSGQLTFLPQRKVSGARVQGNLPLI